MRQKQKVVLREKVRIARWNEFKIVSVKSLKCLVFLVLVIYVSVSLYRLFFISDFFMVKSVEIEPRDGRIDSEISHAVSFLNGHSIFRISLKQVKQDLKEKFPAVRSLEFMRSFPDRIKLHYSLRNPIAVLSNRLPESRNSFSRGDEPLWAMDEDGVRFEATHSSGTWASLPELVFVSTESLPDALSFLKMWDVNSQALSSGAFSFSLRKLFVDEGGEISFYLEEKQAVVPGTRVVWGNFDAQTFSEKFKRFQQVCADLQKKSLRAEYINLREIPHHKISSLGESEVVGQVFVRTSER